MRRTHFSWALHSSGDLFSGFGGMLMVLLLRQQLVTSNPERFSP